MNKESIYQEVTTGIGILIDIRENDEWTAKRIERALHIPLSIIQSELENAFPSTLQESVVYLFCESGRRAEYVVQKLQWGHSSQKKIIPLMWKFDDLQALFQS